MDSGNIHFWQQQTINEFMRRLENLRYNRLEIELRAQLNDTRGDAAHAAADHAERL